MTPIEVTNNKYKDLDLAVMHQEKLGTYSEAKNHLHFLKTTQPQTDIIKARVKKLESDIEAALQNHSWSENVSYVASSDELKDVLPHIEWPYQSIHSITSNVTTASAKSSPILFFLMELCPWFHVHSATIVALREGKSVVWQKVAGALMPFMCTTESANEIDGIRLTPAGDGSKVRYYNTETKSTDSFDLAVYDALFHIAAFAPGLESRIEVYNMMISPGTFNKIVLFKDDNIEQHIWGLDPERRVKFGMINNQLGDRTGFDAYFARLSVANILNGETYLEVGSQLFFDRLNAAKGSVNGFTYGVYEKMSDFKNAIVDGNLKGIKGVPEAYAKHSLLQGNNMSWMFMRRS